MTTNITLRNKRISNKKHKARTSIREVASQYSMRVEGFKDMPYLRYRKRKAKNDST